MRSYEKMIAHAMPRSYEIGWYSSCWRRISKEMDNGTGHSHWLPAQIHHALDLQQRSRCADSYRIEGKMSALGKCQVDSWVDLQARQSAACSECAAPRVALRHTSLWRSVGHPHRCSPQCQVSTDPQSALSRSPSAQHCPCNASGNTSLYSPDDCACCALKSSICLSLSTGSMQESPCGWCSWPWYGRIQHCALQGW